MAGETDKAAGACVDSYGSATGMPQLCVEWMGNQVFWLAVALVAVFLILSRVALPRIAAILAERQGSRDGKIAQAEQFRAKAAEAERACVKAADDARAEAQRIVTKAKEDIKDDPDLAKTRAKAEEEMAAASADADAAVTRIRAGISDAVAEVARDTAAALVEAVGAKADGAAVAAAVNAKMKEGET